MNHTGSNKSGVIIMGILLQLLWLGCILTACWFIQTGSIIVWWCTVSRFSFTFRILFTNLIADVAVDVSLHDNHMPD